MKNIYTLLLILFSFISYSKTIYSVDKDKCIGCNLCVKHCPANAIKMINGKAVIDSSKCIGCDICVSGNGKNFNGCPTKAIKTKKSKIKE